jgi:hypothetical protein
MQMNEGAPLRHIRLWVCSLLVACASTAPSPEEEAEGEDLSTLEAECEEKSVLALCDSKRCELFWCRVVVPHLLAGRPLRTSSGEWVPLPGSIGLRVEWEASRPRTEIFFNREIRTVSDSPSIEAPSAEGFRVFDARDVIQQLVRLQKPGDVATWWASGPKVSPKQWIHPLSHWEREYLQSMSSPTVPAPLRMPPPLEPGRLTPQEVREARQLVGGGANAAQRYVPFESRRRIVAHYVLTHPATIRLQLGLYALARDSNPLHFALERGWQVGRGQEMFTEQEVSRLGAAAEFFAALAVGVAVERAMSLAHAPSSRGSTALYMAPEVERTFVEAVRLRAAHTVEVLSLKERGPVLTGVLDTRTGRTFFGLNQRERLPNLHPFLQKRLDDYLDATGGVTPARAGEPGTHSEIVALNRALHERELALGRPVRTQELAEFVLHNRSLKGPRQTEGVPPPCPNCEAILPPEVRVLP